MPFRLDSEERINCQFLRSWRRFSTLLGDVARDPRKASVLFDRNRQAQEARRFCESRLFDSSPQSSIDLEQVRPDDPSNPLWAHFAANHEGPGIWKWVHYFDIYQRHLGKFVGRDPHIVEIGIYSGGSLSMWRSYFGPRCQITGVDIEDVCRVYEKDGIRVFIGDQADRQFWKSLRAESAPFDVLIDDGGHSPEQQRITLDSSFQVLLY